MMKMLKRQGPFDERQRIEQGKAYRNAFFTLLASLFVSGSYNIFSGMPILDTFSMMMIPTWISISVFYTTCILRDAIDGINYKSGWKWAALTWGIVGIIMAIMSIAKLSNHPIIINGVLSYSVQQALCGICWVEICIVYWIKHFVVHRKAKQMEEA
jgi:hypothetical protein